jgi:hypothetical protein
MIRALDRWLPAYLTRDRRRYLDGVAAPVDVFIAVCDHFEPFHDTDRAGALRAMSDWEALWPAFVQDFEDSSGRGPRHTFFFPIEQYDEEIIARLASLCRKTGSEIEVHLHHQDDTAQTLEAKLREGLARLAAHGALARAADGAARYGFIHGNWALDHSHPQGRHCGVPDELAVLRRTGCYADFTLPSAPDPCQTRTINAIFYAREDGRPRSHETGVSAAAGETAALAESPDHLLLVQGPLGLNWRRRKWGLLPRIENADLTGANPPTLARFRLWMELCPMVKGGPGWIFVKLHTHGGIPRNYRALLGDVRRRFQRDLAELASTHRGLRFHHVTAREMVNLIHAAERGCTGQPLENLDQTLQPPPMLQ